MSSWSMQKFRNFVIPYLIYLGLTYISPAPFQNWLNNAFPELALGSIDLKKPILPIVVVVIVHYLFSDIRRCLNKPFFKRVNETIVERVGREFGVDYNDWKRVRPAYYHVIDSDKSLTYLSDRIKSNGLVWFGFADLRLAAILTFVAWSIGAAASYFLKLPFMEAWIMSAIWSLVLVVVSAFGSEITTRRHIQLVNEQLDQMFGMHRQGLLDALQRHS